MKGRLAPTSAPAETGVRQAPASAAPAGPAGGFVVRGGEDCYRIAGYHRMPPFLTSLAGDADLWLFVASGGGLTAGRVDPDGALFPYLNVDQLHDAHHHTGPVTLIRIRRPGRSPLLWQPFGAAGDDDPAVERNLYKNITGSRIEFEEIRRDLGLSFSYAWASCDAFGWVRTATLTAAKDGPLAATVLDGLRNVLPFGAPLGLYQGFSTLIDAYKRTDADPRTGLATFSLTAGITDRAEALEVLRANTVWCSCPAPFRVHLDAGALGDFRRGRPAAGATALRGVRGNYLAEFAVQLQAQEAFTWHLACDAGRDHVQTAALRDRLRRGSDRSAEIAAALRAAASDLRRYVGSADGIQLTASRRAWSHHFANVLFNIMRGGVFWRNHDVPAGDFRTFVRTRHQAAADRRQDWLAALPAELAAPALRRAALAEGDADLARLSHEYLPLHFGRRHGDPSRPWNRFSIPSRGPDGRRELDYEGNWRDIFQNWEALGAAFPGFLPNLVAKFVNASTVDGFNPYRLTRDGVDWEVVSPEHPWSNIGYWGDHQLIYLLKLLEALRRHDPASLTAMLARDIFSYAEVPYRIRPYERILADPRDTIVFDAELQARITARVARMGTDGKLLQDGAGGVRHVNLFEKLLVPVLSKLSNLVPDAGIWMNTQRPEWNDANNALAGGGASVVTLCYLRRYLAFLADLLEGSGLRTLPMSAEVADWLGQVAAALAEERGVLASPEVDPRDRKRVLDRLGKAFCAYRGKVYAHGFCGRTEVRVADAAAACREALRWADHGIAANRRPDGLYHAYNVLQIDAGAQAVHVDRLPLMLEGQVAALSAGVLDAAASLRILEGLFASDLYRADRRSFLLYPERELPSFLAKNAVPAEQALAVPLLRDLLREGEGSIVARDVDGVIRFAGGLGGVQALTAALEDLAQRTGRAEAVARDREAVLALYESVFDHKAYTGRSGAMYGYEGLGCIYWHMVAKLLLAAQEVLLRAERDGAPQALRRDLAAMYFRIRAGLGYEKSAAEYGAFPTDPYSHTAPDGGARQPGMTGQVKEEILTRLGELGVLVEEGRVRFRPTLLRADEFLDRPGVLSCFDAAGRPFELALPPGSLAFTHCQVPVVYRRGPGPARIRIRFADGAAAELPGDELDAALSAELLARGGRLHHLQIDIPEDALLAPAASGGRGADGRSS